MHIASDHLRTMWMPTLTSPYYLHVGPCPQIVHCPRIIRKNAGSEPVTRGLKNSTFAEFDARLLKLIFFIEACVLVLYIYIDYNKMSYYLTV